MKTFRVITMVAFALTLTATAMAGPHPSARVDFPVTDPYVDPLFDLVENPLGCTLVDPDVANGGGGMDPTLVDPRLGRDWTPVPLEWMTPVPGETCIPMTDDALDLTKNKVPFTVDWTPK